MTICHNTRKARYRDAIAAELALATIGRQDTSHRPRTECRVHRCPHCHGWHLTSRGRRPA